MVKKVLAFLLVMVFALNIGVGIVFAQDIAVTEISPEGGVIATPGEIEIIFDGATDDDIIKTITFKKADGNEVKGGAYVAKGDAENKAVVKFGLLDIGEYVLTIDGTDYFYTVEESNRAIEKSSEDFSAWGWEADEEKDPTAIAEETANISFDKDKYSGQKVSIDSNNDLVPSSGTGYGYVDFYVGDGTSGKFVADLRVKPTIDGHSGVVYLKSPATAERKPLFHLKACNPNAFTSNSLATAAGVQYNFGGSNEPAAKIVDSDGYLPLEFVFERISSDNDWDVKVFNKAYSTTDAVVTWKAPKDDFPTIGYISIYLGVTSSKPDYLPINAYTVSEVRAQSVAYYQQEIESTENSFKVALAFDEDIENLGLTLKKGDKRIEGLTELDQDKRVLTVSASAYLNAGESFTLEFDKKFCGPLEITAKPSKVTETVPVVSGTDISVGVTNNDEAVTGAKALALIYDGENNLLGIETEILDETNSWSSAIDITDYETAAKCKIMYWAYYDGYSSVICEPIELEI